MQGLLLALLLAQLRDPAAGFDRGRAAAAAGDLKTAAIELERAAATFPTWGLAWLELAEVLVKGGGDPRLLEKALAAARALEHQNPRAFRLTGELHERRGERAFAIAAYERAHLLRPEILETRERLGLLLCQEGRYAEALAHLSAVVERSPENRGARANLAEAGERTGDLTMAEAQLRALSDAAPASLLFRRRLADFYARNGDEKRAEEELRKAEQKRTPKKMRPLPASKW